MELAGRDPARSGRIVDFSASGVVGGISTEGHDPSVGQGNYFVVISRYVKIGGGYPDLCSRIK
jgi:hypothetical protein